MDVASGAAHYQASGPAGSHMAGTAQLPRLIQAVRCAGKSADAILADLAKRMNEAPPLLEEPVPIPINGAPVKGAANAKITLVEFSDFQ